MPLSTLDGTCSAEIFSSRRDVVLTYRAGNMRFNKTMGYRVSLALAAPMAAHLLTLLLWVAVYQPNLREASRTGHGISSHRAGKMSAAQVQRYTRAIPAAVMREVTTLAVLGLCCLLGFWRSRWGLWLGYGAGVLTTLVFFALQPAQFYLFLLLLHPLALWTVGYGSGIWTVRWALRGLTPK